MITGKNYIGNTLTAAGTETFTTFNPMKNSPNSWQFTAATPEEINDAMELAKCAFDEFRWMDSSKRAAFLDACADAIMELGDHLIDVYCSETGLPAARARGERGRTVGQLRSFAELLRNGNWQDLRIDTAIPDRSPVPKPDLRKMSIGMGPIVVFGASNFPLAYSTAGGDTASAFAAGCPVVVKAHPMHAGTSERIAGAVVRAAEKTGMPNGVFSNLNGTGIELGKKLVSHPIAKGVGFTGSVTGGRALYDLAAARPEPIPVFAEMGSINPVILMPNYLGAHKAKIAEQYADSITLGAGQFCTNPGLILGIKSDDLDDFVRLLSEKMEPIEPMCMLHPEIEKNFSVGKVNSKSQEGIEVLVEKEVESPNYAGQSIARVSGDQFLQNTQLHHEVFGPYSLIVQCDNLDQLKAVLRNLEGQLTGTVMAQTNELKASGIMEILCDRVGRVIFNGVPTGVEVCPSMLHGGPYPASTDPRFTAVGTDSIRRWVRPVSYQNWPNELLPPPLRDDNPQGLTRMVNGSYTSAPIQR